jgi:ABC-type oligopeptide transport system ATPase subunit
VRHIADRTAVLQQGRLVDLLDAHSSDESNRSPYTQRLFDSAPVPDPALQRAKRARFEESALTLERPDTPQPLPAADDNRRTS